MKARIIRISEDVVYQDEGTKEQFEEQVRLYIEREPENKFRWEEVEE